MGFIGKLFGTDKAVDRAGSIIEKTITGVGNFIDKRSFTEQERAEFSMKGIEMFLRVNEILAGENTIRSVTRRYLAIMIITVFLVLILFAVAMYRFDPGWSKFALEVAKDTQLGYLVLGVGFIYFGLAMNYFKKQKQK